MYAVAMAATYILNRASLESISLMNCAEANILTIAKVVFATSVFKLAIPISYLIVLKGKGGGATLDPIFNKPVISGYI